MRLEGLKICVTGGMGFVGSQTAKSLKGAGAEVIIVDERETQVPEEYYDLFYKADYADALILNSLRNAGVHGFVHCAGSSLVGPSVTDPSEYYNNNVVKTIQMLDSFKTWDIKPFIVFSSSAATYGNPTEVPITEDAVQDPINPYGNTKMMIERILHDYEVYGIRSYCYRYFNAAGADVWGAELGPEAGDTHIIPRIFEAYYSDNVFKLFGTDYDTPDGTCVRDYIHVCDLALAHLLAVDNLSKRSESERYNLGTNNGYSNLQIIEAFKEHVGALEVHNMPRRPGDPDTLIADASLIEKEQNFTTSYSDLKTIMMSTKAWYEKK